MQNEIWKDIQDYEGLYQVSNKGRIKTCKNNRSKIKKTAVNHNGYYTVPKAN